MISGRILVSFRGFYFLKIVFLHGEMFEISSFFFWLKRAFYCKWQGHSVTHPCSHADNIVYECGVMEQLQWLWVVGSAISCPHSFCTNCHKMWVAWVYCGRPFFSPVLLSQLLSSLLNAVGHIWGGLHKGTSTSAQRNLTNETPMGAVIASSNEHAFPHTNDMTPSASLIKVFQYFLLRGQGLVFFFDTPSLGNPTIINKASQMALWILQPSHLTVLKTKSLHSIQIDHKVVPLKKDHIFSTQWKHLDTLAVKITCFHCIGEASWNGLAPLTNSNTIAFV